MSAFAVLAQRYPPELVAGLLAAYQEVEGNFAIKKWKASELDAGHFVEIARRIVDRELSGSHVPITKQLAAFNDQELRRLEQHTGSESFRMLIPRVLKSIANIRNKRGVGHVGEVSPNEMDATLILYSCKWVLSEFVRTASSGGAGTDEAQRLVERIMERRLDLIWKSGDLRRVLQTRLSAREQVLVLLYDQNLTTEDDLRATIEYRNASNFRSILKKLHAERHIEYSIGQPLLITPKGVICAEDLIRQVTTPTSADKAVRGSRKRRA